MLLPVLITAFAMLTIIYVGNKNLAAVISAVCFGLILMLFAVREARVNSLIESENENLVNQAEHDALTGLFNRGTTSDRISSYIETSPKQELHALFMLDLDNFKQVNDCFGHTEGDKALINAAVQLKSCFPADAVIGRLGGDEYMVFIKSVDSEQGLRKKAAEVCEALQFAHYGDGREIQLTCSLGIAVSKGNEKDFSRIYLEADSALYAAKKAGKNQYILADSVNPLDLNAQDDGISEASAGVQLHSLLKYMINGVLLIEVSDDLRALYISPSFYRTLNISPDELDSDGRCLLTLIADEDKENVVSALRSCAESEAPVSLEYRTYKHGSCLWRQLRAVKIPYDESSSPVLLAIVTDVTQSKEADLRLAAGAECVRLALEQTEAEVWVLDLEKHSVSRWDIEKELSISSSCPFEFYSRRNIIHPDFMSEMMRFYSDMQAGVPSGKCAVIRQLDSGKYGWVKLSYRGIFDRSGKMSSAVVISAALPNITDARTRFQQEQQLQELVGGEMLSMVHFNLSEDKILAADVEKVACVANRSISTYHQLMQVSNSVILSEEDRQYHREKFSSDALVSSFESGNDLIIMEYRRMYDGGTIGWVSYSVKIVREPVSGALHGFSYLRDINKRKQWELAVNAHAERDMVTGLYTADTAERIVTHLLSASKISTELCAMTLIRLENLSVAMDEFGPSYTNKLLALAGRFFSLALDNKNVISRYDNEHIAVFTSEIPSAESFSANIADIIERESRLIDGKDNLVYSIGVAILETGESSYSALISSAMRALEQNHRHSSGDKLVVLDSLSGTAKPLSFDTRQTSAERSSYIFKEQFASSADVLSGDEEKNLFIECCTRLLSDDPSSVILSDVMRLLCGYYSASRAYMLSLDKSSSTVTLSSEWAEHPTDSIREAIRSLPLEKLPLVRKAYARKCAIIITGDGENFNAGNAEIGGGVCNFIVVPMLYSGDTTGFICIENPMKNTSSTKPVTLLVPSLCAEINRHKRLHEQRVLCYYDSLTALLNRNSYLEYISGISSLRLSSLGVIYADINGLKAINEEYGSEYGDGVIKSAAGILLGIFGVENVFRISDDEFVAFAKDMQQHLFEEKKALVIEKLSEIYPYGVSVGDAWSSTDTAASKLSLQAEKIMRLAKQDYYRTSESKGSRERPEALERLVSDIASGRYKVCFQPRIEIGSGSICGSEALIRYTDEKNRTLLPMSFIPLLEKENIVRHLDLFVLEEVLQAMRRWKNLGASLPPVSINFSHLTVLDPVDCEAAVELQHKYDIPAEMIEIELSYKVGSIDSETLAAACSRFSAAGYKLALDGFGTDYTCFSIISRTKFNSLKLDRCLVAEAGENKAAGSIVIAAIRLCEALKMKCIAGGVETAVQLERLTASGCRYAQGNFYCRPIEEETFRKKYILRQKPPLP